MIISHRHRFIFVKTAKTAGSSTELFLRQFCGPDDAVTRLPPFDEVIAQELDVCGPQGEGSRRVLPWAMDRRDLRRARRRRSWPTRERFHGHQSATEIRSSVGDEVWASYRKITIVRDPWDATVSRYFWKRRYRRPPPLDAVVERAGVNWSIYSIEDEVAVDTVLRFERLQEDLDRLVEELGVAPRFGLPGAKTGIRPPRTPAHEVLSPVQARRVAELAHREIETFGYEWSGPDPL